MNKNRVETISDGVFSIVMTLLIFNVTVVTVTTPVTDHDLWLMIGGLWPLLVSYALSFLVLSVFWINHHFTFHLLAKNVNRQLNLLNMVYLMLLAFVPFSAHLIGSFPHNEPAYLVYGLNILAIVLLSAVMSYYIRHHADLREDDISPRMVKQGRIRANLSIISYLLGIVFSFVYLPATVFLYLFPMVFNIIPGTLNFAEKHLNLDFG